MSDEKNISSVLNENRSFPPPESFAKSAHISDPQAYEAMRSLADQDPIHFWEKQAAELHWFTTWQSVLDWKEPDARWFVGGTINASYNCLDRHLSTTRRNKAALIWEGEKGDTRTLTYLQLHREVSEFSNALKKLGVSKGDRVALYMPLIPELAIAVLACARIGATHTVVFGGFSAEALRDRINDCGCRMVITADGGYRRGTELRLKAVVDEAVSDCDSIESVIVARRTGSPVNMVPGRDHWWDELQQTVESTCEAEPLDSEHPLFILYTSGTTGKPKGIFHSTGGYLTQVAFTARHVFDLKDGDVYWCTADIGWITGHSYIVYGPLLAGATTLMFEGVPTYPDAGRFWQVVDKYKVNIFYTAPTAIRALQAFGTDFVTPYRLDSLRVLGSVGEPINEEAWHWYNKNIGKERCPIVDTWWQTETGGILISPLAGITQTKPSYATLPLPGVQPMLVDNEGKEIVGNNVEGNLCIRFPWPSIIRTTYGDHERCRQTYFSTYHNIYFTGDGCKRDENGYYRITGRVDDVINVSGHRLGTAEIENAINQHNDVVESAVVGYPHEIKGQGIYAYVICSKQNDDIAMLRQEIVATVNKIIGPIAKPDKIQIVRGLPKTRSGKIMRRILRKVAEGDVTNLGDTSTLLDPTVVEDIKSGAIS